MQNACWDTCPLQCLCLFTPYSFILIPFPPTWALPSSRVLVSSPFIFSLVVLIWFLSGFSSPPSHSNLTLSVFFCLFNIQIILLLFWNLKKKLSSVFVLARQVRGEGLFRTKGVCCGNCRLLVIEKPGRQCLQPRDLLLRERPLISTEKSRERESEGKGKREIRTKLREEREEWNMRAGRREGNEH